MRELKILWIIGILAVAMGWGMAAYAAPADGGVVLPAWVVPGGDASVSDAGADAAQPSVPVVDPQSPDIVSRLISLAVKLAQGSQWGIFAAVAIMLLVNLIWRIKAIKEKLPKSALPWVSVGIGALTGFAVSWASGVVWWKALLNWSVYALAASGLYSAGGKRILKQ